MAALSPSSSASAQSVRPGIIPRPSCWAKALCLGWNFVRSVHCQASLVLCCWPQPNPVYVHGLFPILFFFEKVKDRGTWQAAVHGIAKSQTWLRDWTTTEKVHVSFTTNYLFLTMRVNEGFSGFHLLNSRILAYYPLIGLDP